MKEPRTLIEMMPLLGDEGWHPLTGFAGLEVKVLTDDLDESARRGGRTRLVRFAPGAGTETTFVHDYWEEMYLLEGDLVPRKTTGQADADTPDVQRFSSRPPGSPHGPYVSPRGCLLLEVQYYLSA